MFGPLIEALGGRRSATHEGAIDAVHTWLRSQPKNVFADWIIRFVNSYTIYIEIKSVDNIEQWHPLHLSQVAAHEVINKFTFLHDSASLRHELRKLLHTNHRHFARKVLHQVSSLRHYSPSCR